MSDLTLFTTSLRDLVRPKKMLTLVLLLLLSTGVAALWRYNTAGYGPEKSVEIYNSLATLMIYSFLLVLLTITFGTSIISTETEQKTIVYLLTRPVPRWRILLTKFAAVVLVTTVTTYLAIFLLALITYGPSELGNSGLGRDLEILPIGVLAYGGISLLLAVLLNRPLIFGLLFAFGWETWVPSLPGSFGRLSVMTYLRVLAPHKTAAEIAAEAAAAANPFAAAPDVITHPMAWTVLAATIAVSVLAALVVFSTREYVPREDAA